MKIKDLMIDDWVSVIQNGDRISTQVQSVDCYADNATAFECICDGIYYSEGEFEPIPVTDEFLEKNFDKNRNIPFEWYYIDKCGVENRKDRFVFMRGEETGGIWWICDIKYVHELQHALRLVGLSEIADNLKV